MRFCFRLTGSLGLALSAGWAASPVAPPAASGITSVVRADPRTGKLVRTTLVRNPAVLTAAVDRIALQHALPPELVRSVIQVESNYNPDAVSPKGARGLMQLIPSTARRFGVSDAFNPIENIQGGVKYLSYLVDLYHGNYALVLAAYNAGEQSVTRYGGVPPYPETQKYVVDVGKRFDQTRKPEVSPKRPAETPAAAEPVPEVHVREIVLPDGSVRYVSR